MIRWVEHTGELELKVEAPSEEAVLAEAAEALSGLLSDERGAAARREVSVSASDPATLLAEWLNELVFLSETESFVPERVSELALVENGLRAVVDGRRGTPKTLVKAVTYHRLELAPGDGGWLGRVVLDV